MLKGLQLLLNSNLLGGRVWSGCYRFGFVFLAALSIMGMSTWACCQFIAGSCGLGTLLVLWGVLTQNAIICPALGLELATLCLSAQLFTDWTTTTTPAFARCCYLLRRRIPCFETPTVMLSFWLLQSCRAFRSKIGPLLVKNCKEHSVLLKVSLVGPQPD